MEPYTSLLKWQMSMLEAWADMNKRMVAQYMTVFQHQCNLLKGDHHLRWHNVPPAGSELDEHYGRRSTDVDVRKI